MCLIFLPDCANICYWIYDATFVVQAGGLMAEINDPAATGDEIDKCVAEYEASLKK